MAMRNSSARREGPAKELVSTLGWSPSVLATVRHSTLPLVADSGDDDAATPLGEIGRVGERDALSLIGQLAGWLAFARFAGMGVTGFEPSEWGVVRSRGRDVRLLRLGSAPTSAANEVLAINVLESFATRLGAPRLDSLSQSWAKPESTYVEVHRRLRGAAADRTWFARAAGGSVDAPGADCLDQLAASARIVACDDPAASASILRFAALRGTAGPRVVLLDGSRGSPLEPMSSLGALVPAGSARNSESAAAEAAIARLHGNHAIVAISSWETFDPASRRVVRLLLDSGEAFSWLVPAALAALASTGSDLLVGPPSRHFAVAARTRDLAALEERVSSLAPVNRAAAFESLLLDDDAYGRFLDEGTLPELSDGMALARLTEPARSYLAALALLGQAPALADAEAFLERIGGTPGIESLVREQLCVIDGDRLRFASEQIRRRLVSMLPDGSRAPLSRLAAEFAGSDPLRRAALLIAGGVPESACLDTISLDQIAVERVVEVLGEFDPATLSKCAGGCSLMADAFVRAGRYRDARHYADADSSPEGALARARIERRLGGYGAALAHLEPLAPDRFAASLLAAELHRLRGQHEHAATELQRCATLARSQPERARLDYERAILALDRERPSNIGEGGTDPYLAERHASYLAAAAGDLAEAASHARNASRAAVSVPDRIDAELDLVYALFLSGDWNAARHQAREALLIVEETQGDRAAAGILFTLAFLCADSAQWQQAQQKIDRLRRFYLEREDDRRAREIDLITAQFALGRLRLDQAESLAASLLDAPISIEMREAVAAILDEVAWIRGTLSSPRSSGESQCVELTDRHLLAVARSSRTVPQSFRRRFLGDLARWEIDRLHGRRSLPPDGHDASDQLMLLRSCIALRKRDAAEDLDSVIADLARSLSVDRIEVERPREQPVSTLELDLLRRASTEEFPFAPAALGRTRWRFATRNRLGRWNEIGSIDPKLEPADLDSIAERITEDWHACSTQALLYLEGLEAWSPESRRALAATFLSRAELANLRRLTASDRNPSPRGNESAVPGIVGNSPAIRAMLSLIGPASNRDAPVCIEGESGTGKELIARAIHDRSPRRGRPFTAVNCAALPENLVESELFGCVRGAFTGADRDREGLIEATNGGTLFLDEIGEMALQAQAKLLRFLQEHEFRRVGETVNRRADVRIIAATNRRLDESVDSGSFRDDLYYRIRVIEIQVPPLRERGGDVLALAEHFLARERELHGGGAERFSEEVEDLLLSYTWPGNVRELQNTIRASHALAGDGPSIGPDHLPPRVREVRARKPKRGTLNEELNRFRRDLIERTLVESAGNQSRAAKQLGVSRQVLAYQIKELGILVKRN